MKIFSTGQIREIDACTIVHEPVASIGLMERAAMASAGWLMERYSRDTDLVIFTGPGNNGGDGWALARLLATAVYNKIKVYQLFTPGSLSPDAEANRQRLMEQNLVPIYPIGKQEDFPALAGPEIVIDALFGSGLTRPLSGLAAELVQHINRSGAEVISIDIPSGLFGEDNAGNTPETIIHARHTLSFQFPKLAFFFAENEDCTGSWTLLDIELSRECIDKKVTPFFFIENNDIVPLLRGRRKFSHKGTYGHALLIAGSYGMMGAAVLAARACLRTGAGLATAHIPVKGYEIMQESVPEAIVSLDPSEECFSSPPDMIPYNAVAVGPGIGTGASASGALHELFLKCSRPLVIDADALNLIGRNRDWLTVIPENSILTPHPKEFERIAGIVAHGYERLKIQMDFARQYKLIVLLKGAYTSIALPDGRCYFNSTGNPGMATGGSGDVLTGIIVSLLAQGYKPSDAAIIGVYLHGLSGDLAVLKTGQEALIASDIVDHIGDAFLTLNNSMSFG
jgi:NAD(P)H-hydrate epimerase